MSSLEEMIEKSMSRPHLNREEGGGGVSAAAGGTGWGLIIHTERTLQLLLYPKIEKVKKKSSSSRCTAELTQVSQCGQSMWTNLIVPEADYIE